MVADIHGISNSNILCKQFKMAEPETTLSSSEAAAQWKRDSGGRPLVLVVLGKSGVGKSTFINNLLELEDANKCEANDGASTTTRTVERKEKTTQEITIQMLDTPGLGGVDSSSTKKVLKAISEATRARDKRADTVLYCVSMHPASHIDSSDVKIIKQITSAFGTDLWRHTILCLTFANTCKPENDEGYKSRVESYAQQFQKALRQANVFDVQVQSVFSTRPEKRAIIPAIPVGYYPKKQLPLSQNWSDQLLREILNLSDAKSIPSLLDKQGLLQPAAELGGSITIGTAVGAAIGTAIGLPLFGVGAVPGVAVGGAIGAAVGTLLPTATNKIKNKYMSWKTKKMEHQLVT
jgi:GTPase Era involved in 16S rRNA processing